LPAASNRLPILFSQQQFGLRDGDDASAIQKRSPGFPKSFEPDLRGWKFGSSLLAAPNLAPEPRRFVYQRHALATLRSRASRRQPRGPGSYYNDFELKLTHQS
jgi:hypothetical protein